MLQHESICIMTPVQDGEYVPSQVPLSSSAHDFRLAFMPHGENSYSFSTRLGQFQTYEVILSENSFIYDMLRVITLFDLLYKT